MEHISADELHSRIENLSSEDLILDVRSPSEFNDGHIEGAQNTPHEEVTNEVEDLKKYNENNVSTAKARLDHLSPSEG